MAGVLIVGGSVAGIRVATALREHRYDGAVTVIDREAGPPYDKPSLSKECLYDEVGAPPLAALDEVGVDHRPGVAARSLDLAAGTVATDGGPIAFDRLVVATGSRPRMLPALEGVTNVHVLRTATDAARLSAAWKASGLRVVVLGGGFIGCEAAASARRRGLDVTIVEAAPTLMSRSLAPEEARRMAALHRGAGIRVLAGRPVASVDVDGGRVRALELADGTRVEADLVLVGIGSVPVVEWLGSSGLDVDAGLGCDERLWATTDGRVLAVGDVARWRNVRYGREMRLEHWTSAREQATYAARMVVDDPRVRDTGCGLLPYVWSDQHGRRLQLVGDPHADGCDEVEVPGVETGWVRLRVREGRVVAATALNAQWHVVRLRRLLATTDAPVADAMAALAR